MKKNKCLSVSLMSLILLLAMILFSCEYTTLSSDDIVYPTPKPFVFQGTYKLILVPVPDSGITFPVGVEDNATAKVEKAFYIGEIEVTMALWDTVSRWATEEKEFGPYFGLDHYHHEGYDPSDKDNPVVGSFGTGHNYVFGFDMEVSIKGEYVTPIWCNAFTDWYNEKNGTDLTPVYQDGYGNPIRYINNYDNFFETAAAEANGFRLPSLEEWELAARWNGTNGTNTVTKEIDGINFSEQPIKFTKGNSASGSTDSVENYDENDRVAAWNNNSEDRRYPTKVKTKEANALGLYDMSGNVEEWTSAWFAGSLGQAKYFGLVTKGGSVDAAKTEIAIGHAIASSGAIEQPRGFRVVRNAD